MLFIHTIKKHGQIHVITMQGDLIEASQADKLMQEVDEIILNNNIRFVIDMGTLKYLNSSGLTILIRILTKARKAGGEAVITAVGKRIKELLVITKLNTVFTVADTVEQGIAKLNKLVSN
ncbi:MAG: anti-sigma factor antagonist [Bacteroidetes bacterium]|nr:MAG: anti-sigma factor antagonist [Bacteroidota bacterium]